MAVWPILDRAAFHGIAGETVDALAPETEADPAALLVELLAGFGNAVGSGPHVRVGGDLHTARLFVAVVGKTARARKGTAWSLARWVLTEADPGWGGRIFGGFGSGEAVVDAVRDPTDDDPGTHDHRLLVREGELARVLHVAGRDGSTLSPIIRDAWDGSRLAVRTRKSTVTATGAHVSMIADITMEELRVGLEHVDTWNGFAGRFVWWAACRSKRLSSGGAIDQELIARLARPFRDALAEARRIGQVQRTPDAEELWRLLYEIVDDDTPGMLGAVTSRVEAHILRFALTFALLDGARAINADHVVAAVAMWDYAAASAELVFGPEGTGDKVADRLLAAIATAGDDGLDGTEQHDVFSGHLTARRLESARALLVERGLVITVSQPTTGGRPRFITFLQCEEANQAKKGSLLAQLRPQAPLGSLNSQFAGKHEGGFR